MISTDSTTMAALLAYGKIRHPNSEARALGLALRLGSFIELVAHFDRPQLPIPRATVARRVADCRRAGIAPLRSADEVAQLLNDLDEENDRAALRLLWVLNGRRFHSVDAAPSNLTRIAIDAARSLTRPAGPHARASLTYRRTGRTSSPLGELVLQTGAAGAKRSAGGDGRGGSTPRPVATPLPGAEADPTADTKPA